MANKKEIEIKINISRQDTFNYLLDKLKDMSEQIEDTDQHDVYYSPENDDFFNERYPYKWMRLRYLDDGTAEICFKHFYPEGAEYHTYCDEYQSRVQDVQAIEKIFCELNLRVIADVEKNRKSFLYGRYVVSFDKVKNLGNYIEIEVKDILYEEDEENRLLLNVVRELGISDYTVVSKGYPYLVYYNTKL